MGSMSMTVFLLPRKTQRKPKPNKNTTAGTPSDLDKIRGLRAGSTVMAETKMNQTTLVKAHKRKGKLLVKFMARL